MRMRSFSKGTLLAVLALVSVAQARDVVKKKGTAVKKEIPAQPDVDTTALAAPSPGTPMLAAETGGAPQGGSTMGGKPSPFAANPSPFEDILDQTFLPTQPTPKILRVSRPFFGGTYEVASVSYKERVGGKGTKYQVDASNFAFEAIYPTPLGVRVGGVFSQVDSKVKVSSDSAEGTLKTPVTTKGILVAGAFRNGIGAGLALFDVEEKRSVSTATTSVEEHYGYLLPSLYYGTQSSEFVLTHRRSMRHKTGTTDGFFDLSIEHSFGDMNGVMRIRNNRRSENDDDEKDNFAGVLGLRFMLEGKSFLLATVGFEEPYHTSPSEATVVSVASQTVGISTDYWVASEHVVGGSLQYNVSEGRGGENLAGDKAKLTGSGLTFGASYSYRM